ncbi:MAG: helix-turn-helix domain-containing protein [Oscillospiraceae bacterium]|jgi:transcriptional regulator with XRE-family HTH domain|nr:helix-turn-helix domain-containing protein [Oscillospiraceae bacterium]
MDDDFIAARLTQLRTQKGCSARDMSLSLGQSESYINKIENRRTLPSMTVFLYICEYLGIAPKDFFDTEAADPKILNEIIANLKALSPEQLSNVAAIIKDLRNR